MEDFSPHINSRKVIQMKAKIYSTPKCVFCTRAYNLLKTYDIECEKIMIEPELSGLPTQTQHNSHIYEDIIQKAKDNFDEVVRLVADQKQQNFRSVPQVVINGELKGHYLKLKKNEEFIYT